MGMSTFVYGIIEPDEAYKKAFAAWRACLDVGVDPPDEIYERLGIDSGDTPTERGTAIHVTKHIPNDCPDYEDWIEIDLRALPKTVHRIRIVHSW